MRVAVRVLFFVSAAGFVVVACTGSDVAPPPAVLPEAGALPAEGGTVVDAPNTSCSVGSDCKSGQCIDGFCCNRGCGEPCEACNLPGLEGTCSLVTGAPIGKRTPCAGGEACAGSCNGTSSQCTYPSTSVICGAACDGKCDGSGKCSSATGGSCPGGFACTATGCGTSCTSKSECQPFFDCVGGKCERPPESDCLDGTDNNGDGLADCADPSCNAKVECVPGPPAGGELGLFQAPGACPVNFATSEPWHQNLQKFPCTGCTCQTRCEATATLWENPSDCSSGGHSHKFLVVPSATPLCASIISLSYVTGLAEKPTVADCVGAGTATQQAPTWGIDKTFCAAKTTSTCPDTQRCVARRSAKVCARVGQSDACPGGYGADQGVFFSSYTPGSCNGSCSTCTPATQMTCKQVGSVMAYSGASCSGTADAIPFACGGAFSGKYQAIGDAIDKSGTDNCKPDVTTVDPVATGGARVCCQQ